MRTPALKVPLAPEKFETEVSFTTIAADEAVLPAVIALAATLATVPEAAAVPAEKFHVTVVCAPNGSHPNANASPGAILRHRRPVSHSSDSANLLIVEFRTGRILGRASERSVFERVDMVQDRFFDPGSTKPAGGN